MTITLLNLKADLTRAAERINGRPSKRFRIFIDRREIAIADEACWLSRILNEDGGSDYDHYRQFCRSDSPLTDRDRVTKMGSGPITN